MARADEQNLERAAEEAPAPDPLAEASRTAGMQGLRQAFNPLELPTRSPNSGEDGLANWAPETLQAFLKELSRFGNASAACRATGMHEGSMYRLRDRSPEFKVLWEEARRHGIENLENEALRRASEGVERLVLYKGIPVTVVVRDAEGNVVKDADGRVVTAPLVEREYSDTLMLRLLAAYNPKFKEKSEVAVKDERPSSSAAPQIDLTRLSDDELRSFRELLAKARPAQEIDVTPEKGDAE